VLERMKKGFVNFLGAKVFGVSPERIEQIKEEVRTGNRKTIEGYFADKVAERVAERLEAGKQDVGVSGSSKEKGFPVK